MSVNRYNGPQRNCDMQFEEGYLVFDCERKAKKEVVLPNGNIHYLCVEHTNVIQGIAVNI